VIGIVRNRGTSLPGLLELENQKNVHVMEADVTDSAALKVRQKCPIELKSLSVLRQEIAKNVESLTGGTLNNLINNAALSSQDRAIYEMDA
jgi:NAD(P)-dependent dehydrogenase (short-subunit alcohol dehydrogenase family)